MDEVEITIIGAGVIGLAITAALSKEYSSIVVLERHGSLGQETSSRNSEVIHAGIYYPTETLKAQLCVEGAQLLYEYCNQQAITYAKLGKLIVATDYSELPQLYELLNNGQQNGVKGLHIIEKREVSKVEPLVIAQAAIHSPNTGIIDTHSLMKHLYAEACSSGAIFSFHTAVNFIERVKKGYVVGIENDNYRFLSQIVINAAGLQSDHIASLVGIDVDTEGYRLEYSKGSYFVYEKPSPVRMLVYPLPREGLKSLGIHATLDLGGRLRFGPDVEPVDSINYTVNRDKRDVFYESVSKFIRSLDKEAFIPDIAGIRPVVKANGMKDFIIRHEAKKGLEGFINLIGIESPGLSAALSIAKYIKTMIKGA